MAEDRNERVRRRAYEIWERGGKEPGREREHWEQAEREVGDEGEGKPKGRRPGATKPPASRKAKAAKPVSGRSRKG